MGNQETLKGNQEVIVTNQASIISNQKQIVDNQATLEVVLQTQAYLLNLVRKLTGNEESIEETTKFLDGLKEAAQAKALAEAKGL